MGVWVTKPGHEEDFIATWRELGDWTQTEIGGNASAKLLRDLADPRRFVSIGPWDSLEAIEAWRALPGFRERVARMRELLDSFEPYTLDLVAEVG